MTDNATPANEIMLNKSRNTAIKDGLTGFIVSIGVGIAASVFLTIFVLVLV